MDVRCFHCDERMILMKEYGDGYIEPKEMVYICGKCGRKYIWRQDTGWIED